MAVEDRWPYTLERYSPPRVRREKAESEEGDEPGLAGRHGARSLPTGSFSTPKLELLL